MGYWEAVVSTLLYEPLGWGVLGGLGFCVFMQIRQSWNDGKKIIPQKEPPPSTDT